MIGIRAGLLGHRMLTPLLRGPGHVRQAAPRLPARVRIVVLQQPTARASVAGVLRFLHTSRAHNDNAKLMGSILRMLPVRCHVLGHLARVCVRVVHLCVVSHNHVVSNPATTAL